MNIGVIGAGTMGVGIAQVFAQHPEYQVFLSSSSEESSRRGKNKLRDQLLQLGKKGKLAPAEVEATLERVHTGEMSICAPCEIVIEAVPESIEKKREVFLALEGICREDCVFASDTSSLSITEMAVGIRQPVIGMHFFNPAPVMKLVEVSSGLNTPPEVVERIMALARSVGKTPVEVKESAGFVVNRMLIPMINEAIGLYADGVASIEDIDTAMMLGANHRMGPLALGDLIGLDVCLAIMEVIQAETGDAKYRPHPLLRKMVRGGHLGKKTGIGFYKY